MEAYSSSLLREECFLKQKSRVNWLKCGDNNNKFFFNCCKGRWNTNKIFQLKDASGATVARHSAVSKVVVDYFAGDKCLFNDPQVSRNHAVLVVTYTC